MITLTVLCNIFVLWWWWKMYKKYGTKTVHGMANAGLIRESFVTGLAIAVLLLEALGIIHLIIKYLP